MSNKETINNIMKNNGFYLDCVECCNLSSNKMYEIWKQLPTFNV